MKDGLSVTINNDPDDYFYTTLSSSGVNVSPHPLVNTHFTPPLGARLHPHRLPGQVQRQLDGKPSRHRVRKLHRSYSHHRKSDEGGDELQRRQSKSTLKPQPPTKLPVVEKLSVRSRADHAVRGVLTKRLFCGL